MINLLFVFIFYIIITTITISLSQKSGQQTIITNPGKPPQEDKIDDPFYKYEKDNK